METALARWTLRVIGLALAITWVASGAPENPKAAHELPTLAANAVP